MYARLMKKVSPDVFINPIAKANNTLALQRLSTKFQPMYTKGTAAPVATHYRELTIQLYYHTSNNELEFTKKNVETYKGTPDEHKENLGKVEIVLPEITPNEVKVRKGYSKAKTLITFIRLLDLFNIEMSDVEVTMAQNYITTHYKALLPELFKHQSAPWGTQQPNIRLRIRDFGQINSKTLLDYVDMQKFEEENETLKKIARMAMSKNEFIPNESVTSETNEKGKETGDNVEDCDKEASTEKVADEVETTTTDAKAVVTNNKEEDNDLESLDDDESTDTFFEYFFKKENPEKKVDADGKGLFYPDTIIKAMPLHVPPPAPFIRRSPGSKKKDKILIKRAKLFFDVEIPTKKFTRIMPNIRSKLKPLKYEEWKDLPMVVVKRKYNKDGRSMAEKYPGHLIYIDSVSTEVFQEYLRLNLHDIRKERQAIDESKREIGSEVLTL
ncbi:hypothetical protein H4219_004472 [Mycoemilia scoparia]|uniref:Uncharacterized protein n=1 Tax=Mycoemilia scoparia TaxID=417184 RepID=A0A9W7ZXD1_9FUNG|nr:hypothetical protein H4219_004472 [Mycoemilia scoparia]